MQTKPFDYLYFRGEGRAEVIQKMVVFRFQVSFLPIVIIHRKYKNKNKHDTTTINQKKTTK